ncbi:MAG: phosphoribosylglycinamide formyltransferase [Pseudomonadales bacterium]
MAEAARLVILVSGSGSNLQAFIDATQNGVLDAKICAVISNRAEAYGLQRAANADIPTQVINHRQFDSREAFDTELLACVQHYQADLILLAGFMRILTPVFVGPLEGHLLNIHPSLLPNYPGLHTHQRALDAGDTEHGVTVHFVTQELDSGAPIIQAKVPVLPDDNATTLAERVLKQEHIIYPLAANWYIEGRVRLHGGRALLDGETLPPSGYAFNAKQ